MFGKNRDPPFCRLKPTCIYLTRMHNSEPVESIQIGSCSKNAQRFWLQKKTIHPCFFQNFKLHHLKVRSCSLIFWWTELCWFKKESLKQVTRFLRSIRYLIGMGGRSEVVNGSPNKIGEMIPLELTSFLEDSLGDVLIFSILSILSSMKLYYCALNLPPTQ